MTYDFQVLLQKLCTTVTLSNSNDTHDIYVLDTSKEAQLAHDVLSAHGFDVRMYHDAAGSRLYIAKNAPVTPDNIHAAENHITMLREILDSVSANSRNDYKISFLHTPGFGKQISIHFPALDAAGEPPAAAVSAARPVAPAVSSAAAAAMPRYSSGVRIKRRKTNLLHSGPQLGRSLPFGESGQSSQKVTIKQSIINYFLANFSQSFFLAVGMFLLAAFILSLLIVARGMACPDFAHINYQSAWYCKL